MSKKRRFGDRKDGRLLRSLDAHEKIAPFFMKTRQDASNHFKESIDLTQVEPYLKQKRQTGYPGMGILHLFLAAYVRVISQRPALNRFVSGQRIYARNNIQVVMTVKPNMNSETAPTTLKVAFTPTDTISDIYEKLNKMIREVKQSELTDTDQAAEALMKLPRLLLKFIMTCLRCLDYFGLLPRSLDQASPFHGSLVITDLGSIGLPPVFHHLYDFGNVPLFISFGSKRRENTVNTDGSVTQRKYIDFTLTMDERICDGFYFSTAFKYLRSYLRDPSLLDFPPEQVAPDID